MSKPACANRTRLMLHQTVIVACCAALLAAFSTAAAGETVPRYRFEPGRELVYERRTRVLAADGTTVLERNTDQFRLRCLRREGNRRLLLIDWVRAAGAPLTTPRGMLLEIDERGQRWIGPEFLSRIAEMEPVFDVLPLLRSALEPGPQWTSEADLLGQRWVQRERAPTEDGGEWEIAFRLDRPTFVDMTGGQCSRGRYWFDPRVGAVVRVEGVRTTPDGVEQVVWRLHGDGEIDEAWRARRLEELEDFLRCLRSEDTLLERLVSAPASLDSTLSRLERIWAEYRFLKSLRSDSPFLAFAAARERLLAEDLPRLAARGRLAGSWLERQAADWSLQDQDGDTVLSEVVRGAGPVLELFWSARSAASLRVLTQFAVRERDARGATARLVCINVDGDVALAHRAARTLAPALRHVFAGPPLDGQSPLDLPTLRLLDADGVIRRVSFGWRADAEALLPGD